MRRGARRFTPSREDRRTLPLCVPAADKALGRQRRGRPSPPKRVASEAIPIGQWEKGVKAAWWDIDDVETNN